MGVSDFGGQRLTQQDNSDSAGIGVGGQGVRNQKRNNTLKNSGGEKLALLMVLLLLHRHCGRLETFACASLIRRSLRNVWANVGGVNSLPNLRDGFTNQIGGSNLLRLHGTRCQRQNR